MPYKITDEPKPKKNKFIPLAIIRAPRNERMDYYNRLNVIVKQLKNTGEAVKAMSEAGARASAINSFINRESVRIQRRVDELSLDVSRQFVDRVSNYTDAQVKKNIAKAVKVPIEKVAYLPESDELATIETLREVFIAGNVQLIKTIPAKYFNELSQAVSNNFRGIDQVGDAKSLAGRIYDIGNISRRRAAFVARDQTAKVTAALSQERSRHAGAKKYIWRTAEDQRVVGDPGGLYPKASKGHGNHYKRNGRVYFFDRPFADGLPGDAYGCRCYAEPVLQVDELFS
jgi:uncharacterized protein with gpF-like domain